MSDHWLTFNDDRKIVGCHCGYRADLDSDCGWGDSVVEHLIATGIRQAADSMAAKPDEYYPTDVFRVPTTEQYGEINALLKRERGHQLDGIAADCMRRAYSAGARILRELADDVESA